MPKIIAILVTYNPIEEKLKAAINSIMNQVDYITIIDNGSKFLNIDLCNNKKITLKKLNNNEGIGYAQNIGINIAIKKKCNYVFLMDQDSIFAHDTILTLLNYHTYLETNNTLVGAVGVAYQDTNNKLVNHVWRDNGKKIIKKSFDPVEPIVEVDFTIASGSLISINTLKQVGIMDAGLFIDLVDIEWGLRARSKGYKNFQINQCIMQHTIGDRKVKILGKNISVHAPIRNYYLIRNSIILYKRKRLNRRWRFFLLFRSFAFFFIFSIFIDKRGKRIYLMLNGFKDGFLNHSNHLE